jgi:glutamate-1-semialdehyde 2,1-aminomutase
LPSLNLKKSKKLMVRANELIPGGTNSGARSTITRGIMEGFPISTPAFIDRAVGSHAYDIDGNEYIDYICGFGPIILGHANKKVGAAVKRQVDRGTIFGANNEMEIDVAEKMVKHVPGAEQVVLGNTGSEADSIALRLARAVTGKQRILKFEGHYHGWHDWDMVGNAGSVLGTFAKGLGQKVLSSDGVSESILKDVTVIPWNEPEILERTIRLEANTLAAVFIEGYQSNNGVIPADKGYLELLRKLTKQNDVTFIMDEVITGFRFGLGGFQAFSGVTGDLAVFSKAMANGFPISAVTGKKRYMEPISSEQVNIAGTFSGNPVSVAAAQATISELEEGADYDKLYKKGKRIMKGIEDALSDNKIPGIVQGPGPMWSVYFTDLDAIRNVRDVYGIRQYPHVKRSATFWDGLSRRGVLVSPTRYGRMYISFAHTNEDVDKTIEASQEAMKDVRASTK